MPTVKFGPIRDLERMSRRINETFGHFDHGGRVSRKNFAPRVDVKEDELGVYLQVELPGVTKEDVDITVDDDRVLAIKGSKRQQTKAENERVIRLERTFGEFVRSFTLPDYVSTDEISAKFTNGVLNINLKKLQPIEPKEVKIEIG